MKNHDLIYSFYKLLKTKSTIPRWIIFILDLYICAFSLFFAYWLRFNMDLQIVNEHGFKNQILLVTVLNIIFFRIFHTYAGVIRLSSAQEGLRCVSAVFCSFFILLISIVISAILRLPYLLPTSVLFIYFFTASFLIFAYRIFVKQLYHRSLHGRFTAENVLIYGKTINGSFLKTAIESITDHQYRVIGFIVNDKNLTGKSIDNAKIYSFEKIKIVIPKYKVKYLFVTAEDPDIEMKNTIVDYCLSKDINVKVIPAAEKWLHGQLQTTQLKNLKIEDLLSRPDIKLAPGHIQEYLTGKRILITGAAGSIGSEIVKQLVRIDVELLILCDNRETGLYELQYQLQQMTKKDNIIVRISDVRSTEVMQNIFETYKPQVVFHAAAYKHVPLMEIHACEAIKNNVLGTKIVADLSVKYDVERFVFISTDKAINPTNVMGASKRIAEMYVGKLQSSQKQIQRIQAEEYVDSDQEEILVIRGNTKFIITRFGNVLGSNGSVIPRFQKQIDKGGPVTVTHPEIIRYFMTIPEACSLVLEACTMGNGGEIFVFDMGDPVKIVDLATKMIKLSGLTPGTDIMIEFTGLRPGEKLYEELLNKNEEVIPTHHDKIMISRADKVGQPTIFKNIDHLISLAEKSDNILVVKQMKLIVTEFKSKNSAFENLDEIEIPVIPGPVG
jgi:FlaA1/EpsC-like NDP-sugar epimerase